MSALEFHNMLERLRVRSAPVAAPAPKLESKRTPKPKPKPKPAPTPKSKPMSKPSTPKPTSNKWLDEKDPKIDAVEPVGEVTEAKPAAPSTLAEKMYTGEMLNKQELASNPLLEAKKSIHSGCITDGNSFEKPVIEGSCTAKCSKKNEEEEVASAAKPATAPAPTAQPQASPAPPPPAQSVPTQAPLPVQPTQSVQTQSVPTQAPLPVQPTQPVQTPVPTQHRAPCTPEEDQLVRWFRESHVLALDAICVAPPEEDYVWVDFPCSDVHTIEIGQERMKQIGLVYSDGRTPTREEPATLYWIQSKPSKYKSNFGVWDPVGSQWRIYPKRVVVPVEQRIAPVGVYDNATFKAADYGDESVYTDTALEPGLPYILSQIKTLGEHVEVPAGSGWGRHEDGKEAYYTPQLRHLVVDEAISAAAGKKYIYRFPGGRSVKPVEGKAKWSATNSCWVYPIDVQGRLMHDDVNLSSCCEEKQDAAMRGE